MTPRGPEPTSVVKTMCLSPAEFAQTISRLLGHPQPEAASMIEVPLGTGRLRISFEPLLPARLGGLLELPRARVTLGFDGVSGSEREAFLARFDRAFQRGGG